jgi:AAA domain
MAAADPRCEKWNWAEEEDGVRRLCYRFVTKVMRENGEDLGHTLPDKLCDAWNRVIAQGDIPEIFHNRGGACVRPNKRSGTKDKASDAGEVGETTSNSTDGPQAANDGEQGAKQEKKYRFKFTPSWELRPGAAEVPYLIDELIPSKGIVLLWGPPKCLKSFMVADMMWHVANRWEYRDRAVNGGTVMYCALSASRHCDATTNRMLPTGPRSMSCRDEPT